MDAVTITKPHWVELRVNVEVGNDDDAACVGTWIADRITKGDSLDRLPINRAELLITYIDLGA